MKTIYHYAPSCEFTTSHKVELLVNLNILFQRMYIRYHNPNLKHTLYK